MEWVVKIILYLLKKAFIFRWFNLVQISFLLIINATYFENVLRKIFVNVAHKSSWKMISKLDAFYRNTDVSETDPSKSCVKLASVSVSVSVWVIWRITNRQTFRSMPILNSAYHTKSWYDELQIGRFLKVCRFLIRHTLPHGMTNYKSAFGKVCRIKNRHTSKSLPICNSSYHSNWYGNGKLSFLGGTQNQLPWLMVLVDGTVHGDGYIIPIVIVCKLCKWITCESWDDQSFPAKSCNGVMTLTKKTWLVEIRSHLH